MEFEWQPRLGLGTLGQAGHGRSTLAAALSRRHGYVDCFEHTDGVRDLIVGGARVDAVILVVAADEGVRAQTREQVRVARRVGVACVVVFLNKCDLVEDGDMLGLAEAEVRELLSAHGFPGAEIPVVRGSALRALEEDPEAVEEIDELARRLDTYVPDRVREADRPFLLAIEGVFDRPGDAGPVVTGRILRGTVRSGDEIEIVGGRASAGRVICAGVEIFGRPVVEGEAGHGVGVLLRGVGPEGPEVARGQVLAAPGTATAYRAFEAEVYLRSEEEGGFGAPVAEGRKARFFFRSAEFTGTIGLPEGVREAAPGAHSRMRVTLERPVAMEVGLRFVILEGGRPVGVGVVAGVAGVGGVSGGSVSGGSA
ncbi:hypothetical protein SGFS_066810 [Streptomyces graminofaciens]|uniref:Elongation factor Tu n=1 Tax=Streptomyces graminofaciens TaxID=68212 RepID=A0ABM7FGH7_9ACTN|nr:GTP-binding protein [Streptomyces graminofaciens]BBC35387.1 hypothetical protein SGFS_066810 [Streptomyces graminofaciens]